VYTCIYFFYSQTTLMSDDSILLIILFWTHGIIILLCVWLGTHIGCGTFYKTYKHRQAIYYIVPDLTHFWSGSMIWWTTLRQYIAIRTQRLFIFLLLRGSHGHYWWVFECSVRLTIEKQIPLNFVLCSIY